MAEQKQQPVKRRKPTPRPPRHHATCITIWSQNGDAVPEQVLADAEQAVTTVIMAASLNSGTRLLTQTNRT